MVLDSFRVVLDSFRVVVDVFEVVVGGFRSFLVLVLTPLYYFNFKMHKFVMRFCKTTENAFVRDCMERIFTASH